jgi:hypothetical protein
MKSVKSMVRCFSAGTQWLAPSVRSAKSVVTYPQRHALRATLTPVRIVVSVDKRARCEALGIADGRPLTSLTPLTGTVDPRALAHSQRRHVVAAQTVVVSGSLGIDTLIVNLGVLRS